jgi:transposase
MARKRRSFARNTRRRRARLRKVGDRGIGQIAKDLDLTETALREWVRCTDVETGV